MELIKDFIRYLGALAAVTHCCLSTLSYVISLVKSIVIGFIIIVAVIEGRGRFPRRRRPDSRLYRLYG
jgi:hypothetical protein